MFPDSLGKSGKALLSLESRFSRSLSVIASLDITLPRYVKSWTGFRVVPSGCSFVRVIYQLYKELVRETTSSNKPNDK